MCMQWIKYANIENRSYISRIGTLRKLQDCTHSATYDTSFPVLSYHSTCGIMGGTISPFNLQLTFSGLVLFINY